MEPFDELASSVKIIGNRLSEYNPSLSLIGQGRSAFVFRLNDIALKVFFPQYSHLAALEADIYTELDGISYYPALHGSGPNYIVIDYIEGLTFFECLTKGVPITEHHIKEVDIALNLAIERGLNPSDIHLRNIILTPDNEIKLIDVARFRQEKDDTQWEDLKKAYTLFYRRPFLPKKVPAFLLNRIAFLYKKDLIPF